MLIGSGQSYIPLEMTLLPSECKGIWKALPISCVMYSALLFLQEAKQDGEIVTLIPEPAGQI